jgi:hypothetical protein
VAVKFPPEMAKYFGIPDYLTDKNGDALPHATAVYTKSIYGLPTAGNLWQKELNKLLVDSLGFKQMTLDQCVFIKYKCINGRNCKLVVLTWVDDAIAAVSDMSAWDWLTSAIKQEKFEFTDNGKCGEAGVTYVGCRITQSEDLKTVTIDQFDYVDGLKERYKKIVKDSAKKVPLPAGTTVNRVPQKEMPREELQGIESRIKAFQTVMGSLIFLACFTGVAIIHPVCQLAQVMSSPLKKQMELLEELITFVCHNKALFKLTYRQSDTPVLEAIVKHGEVQVAPEAFVDANYAAHDHLRSIAGWVIMLAGAAVTWSSKTIKTLATSTTNAEIHALFNCSKDVVWTRRLIGEMGYLLPPTIIHEDNSAAQSWANSLDLKQRNKHLEIKNFYVRQLKKRNEIVVVHVDTKNQLADPLTKNLPKDAYWGFMRTITGAIGACVAMVLTLSTW